MSKIALWIKETSNLMSAGKGLTEEEIQFLHSLKPGDRLIVFKNDKKFSENSPHYSLQKYENANKKKEEF
jgi:hypothetical protein